MTTVPRSRLTACLSGLVAALAIAAPQAARTQGVTEQLSVHGFMTQAYARSTEHQFLGIGPDGTADYRVAALQFRYAFDPKNAFVLQFSHERMGESVLGALEPDVALDWVFAEHRFDDYTAVRAGRVKNPVGIYNEIRDVGTLLPLYRPPTLFYNDQVYTTETVNGVSAGRRIPLGSWELDVDGYFGSWSYRQTSQTNEIKVNAGYGGQVWVRTPLENVRIGAGAGRNPAEGIAAAGGRDDPQWFWSGSLDGAVGPLTARSEYGHSSFGDASRGYDGHMNSYYGQLIYALTDQLDLVGQGESIDLRLLLAGPFPLAIDENAARDFAAAIRYTPYPFMVLKAEGHHYRGYDSEDPSFVIGVGGKVTINYMLLSLSVSF